MSHTAMQEVRDPRTRSPFRCSTRGYVTLALWAVGLLVATTFNGFEVTEEHQRLYNSGMRKAEVMRDVELEQDTLNAEIRLRDAKTWGWWFGFDSEQDMVVQRRRRELKPLTEKLQRLTYERNEIMKAARQQVGVWSEYGVSEVRAHFWNSVRATQAGAKRQTMWDGFFMILFDRESSIGEMVGRLVIHFFTNLFIYGIFGTISFLFSVYGVISMFAPSAIQGLAFFVACVFAAGSVVFGFFAAIGGTLYVGARATLRLEGQRRRQRLR